MKSDLLLNGGGARIKPILNNNNLFVFKEQLLCKIGLGILSFIFAFLFESFSSILLFSKIFDSFISFNS